MAESAFVVLVPEAEPLVAHLREQFDPVAKLGMPAHVTLLYPFMSPELIDTAVVEQARAVVAGAYRFIFTLAKVSRFTEVLYLAPEPSAPFIALTERLVRQFPKFPPYGGQHKSVVPHVTAAHGAELEHSRIETELRFAISARGEIACLVSEVALMQNASGRWQPMHVFPLAGSVNAAA